MILKKIFAILGILVLGFSITSCSDSVVNSGVIEIPEAASDLSVCIPKIGKADNIILKTAKHSVMIDCGEEDDSEEILSKLLSQRIKALDYLIITHFDKDHIGGAAEILENIKVKNIIFPNYIGSTNEYKAMQQAINDSDCITLTENEIFILDDTVFKLYPAEKKQYTEGDNDFSIVTAVYHGSDRMLLAGDSMTERLSELSGIGTFDLLKVPHHGIYCDGSVEFIQQISPAYAVITDSKKNPADSEITDALDDIDAVIFSTKDGDVNIISSGSGISIQHQ